MEIKLDNFQHGFDESFGKGKEDPQTFAASTNLIPTKAGSLETVYGYSTTGGLASLPTGFPVPASNSTATYNAASMRYAPFPYSAEDPTAYDGRLYYFRDNQGSPVDHYVLDTWFKGSTTKVSSPYGGFIPIDEYKIFPAGADVTIAGASTHTISVANADNTHGLQAATDYYNTPPWRIEWTSGSTTKYATVTDYAVSSHTATITVLEDLGTGGDNWTTQAAPDTFTLRRWFHSAANMLATYGTTPGTPFCVGGRLRATGGGVSNSQNQFPWVAQYINRTFFTGHASAIAYQGTYVDQLETKGLNLDAVAYLLQGGTIGVVSATPAVPAGAWMFYYTLEFDGYEEGILTYGGSTGTTDGSTQALACKITIPFSCLSKRVTAVNWYVRFVDTTTLVQSQTYFIRRFDLVTPTAGELSAWTFATTFVLDGTSSATAQCNGTDWANRGGTYYSRTGRSEETSTQRNIVNWQYTYSVAGRQFFASYYDPNGTATYKDSLRYTGFDFNGNPTTDVIPADRTYFETDIGSGDPSSIQGLAENLGWLVVFKNNSIHALDIGPFPEAWTKVVLTNKDGTVSPQSIRRIPDFGIIFADNDHIKILQNQKIVPLTHNLPTTYGGYTKTGIVIWYDKIDRSINFSTGASSSLYWKGYLDLLYQRLDGKPAIPWYEVIVPSPSAPEKFEFVATERDGSVILGDSAATAVMKWHSTDYTFGGQAIVPYLKTQAITPDPRAEHLVDKVLIFRPAVGTAGTFDNSVTVDTTATNFTGQDKSKKYLLQKMPVTAIRKGRVIQVQYNTNAAGESLSNARIQLGGIYIYSIPMLPSNQSV